MTDGCRYFVVRHGNTFCADERVRRIGSRTDLPLTREGEDQGIVLGRWFDRQGIRFDEAFAGSLRRSRHTAELILARQSNPPALAYEPWLDEIDHGPDEGLPETEVVARNGEAIERWDRDAVPPPNWIVRPEWRREAWRAFLNTERAGNVLLVTSNGAARFGLLLTANRERLPSMRLRTGAFGVIATSASRGVHLERWDVRPGL